MKASAKLNEEFVYTFSDFNNDKISLFIRPAAIKIHLKWHFGTKIKNLVSNFQIHALEEIHTTHTGIHNNIDFKSIQTYICTCICMYIHSNKMHCINILLN